MKTIVAPTNRTSGMAATAQEPELAKRRAFALTALQPGRLSAWRARSGALPWALAVGLVGIVIGLGASGNVHFNWSYALVDALFALGTGVAISWAGVPAFGQALFFAAGGYTAALLVDVDLPMIVVLLAGVMVAGVLALVFASLAINLSFTSFAMLSLVVAQAGNQLIYTLEPLGGENGLYGVQRPTVFGYSLNGNAQFYWYCLATLVVVVALARWLYQSTTGRSIRAVRDDALRAEALGVKVKRVRITAFAVGGGICGLAGVLYAQLQGVVDPSMGGFLRSTVAVMMVVLGGLGTFFGAVVGGVVYRWLELFFNNHTSTPSLWLGIVFVLVVLLNQPVAGLLGRLRSLSARRRPVDEGSPR
jgi:branched-chain amino acid transport system permease protein